MTGFPVASRAAWAAPVLLSIASAMVWLAACGGGETAAPGAVVGRVVDSERVLTIDDVLTAGAKKGKEYDVTGLTGATGAWLVFYGSDPSARKDYEIRIYPSHEAAVRDGTAFADEGVGEGMKAKKDAQTWPEGVRDRWFAGGVTDVSSAGSRQGPGPKYWNYVIYGNAVMLCQGLDAGQSLETCSALVEALGGPNLLD